MGCSTKATIKNFVLFSQDQLDDFEQIRREAYSHYEKGNPQFADYNYDSWAKGKIESRSVSTTLPKKAIWALVGYDHSVANNCIKEFIQSCDLKHVLNVIEVLGIKAFHCPVIKEIILALNNKYSISLWMGDKATSKLLQGFFHDIGPQLLIDTTQTIKSNKAKLVVHRLQSKLSKKYKRDYSTEDTLKHLNNVYKTNFDKLREEPIYQHGAKKHKTIKNIESLLLKTEDKLQNTKNPKMVADLNNERQELKSQLNELKNLEDQLHKEARKLTIKYLEQETAIKLGSTYFKDILKLAKQLDQA